MVPSIEVYDSSTGEDVLVGRAYFTLRRGAISTAFSYDESYVLSASNFYAIDPAFPVRLGSQHCLGLPGAFKDCSPDRWGRHLIEREQQLASQDNSAFHHPDDVDFLLGVFDETREGSLRFREPDGPFLAESGPIPPIIQLPKLLDAARSVVTSDARNAQIKELLQAGSASLGGARPKASVRDGEKLLIAKFSHPQDEWDVMMWEKTALDMAAAIGIEVPKAKLIHLGQGAVLALERFDRYASSINGLRIPFMSGMTLLEMNDGNSCDYVELAEMMLDYVEKPQEHLVNLFCRIAFSVAIGNTDDHLRNWGFLRKQESWQLSPLFDINPNPEPNAQRVTSIAGYSGNNEVQGLKELAVYTGLDDVQAKAIIEKVLSVTRQWKTFAKRNGCTENQLKLFAGMFNKRIKDLETAFI